MALLCAHQYLFIDWFVWKRMDWMFWLKIAIVALVFVMVFVLYYIRTRSYRKLYVKNFWAWIGFLIAAPFIIVGLVVFSSFIALMMLGLVVFVIVAWLLLLIFGGGRARV